MIKVGKLEVNNDLTVRGQAIATVIVLIICGVMAWISLRDFITVSITKTSGAATATVTSSDIRTTRRSGKRRANLYVSYRYTVDGCTYETEQAVWWARSTSRYPVGKEIKTVYAKSAPEKSRIQHLSVFLLMFALLGGYISIAALRVKIKQSKEL